MNSTEFSLRMAAANEITIPLIGIEPMIGFDGTYHGFAHGHKAGGFQLMWWSDGPKAWQPIYSLVYRVCKLSQIRVG